MVPYDDYEQVAIADLPGLIPGSHKNHGLGKYYFISLSLLFTWFFCQTLAKVSGLTLRVYGLSK